jgi:hypothetical protein
MGMSSSNGFGMEESIAASTMAPVQIKSSTIVIVRVLGAAQVMMMTTRIKW